MSSSSSSSSDSSGGRRSRLSSLASALSLTSSDSESLPGMQVQTGKNRLVLNDRVLVGSKPRPASQSGQHGKKMTETADRPRFAAHTSNHEANKATAGVRPGKRKRVKPQMRRESTSVNNRGKTRADPLTKKKTQAKEPAAISVQARHAWPKPATATQSDPLSLLSSSPSSSAVSSPRPTPPRKSAVTTSGASSSVVREGEMDAFGRYRCRKSVSGSASTPPRNARPVSPMSAFAVAAKSMPSPASSTSPSPRKKRRVASYFDVDHMALDNLQAQERELAWIRSQHKQAQNLSRPSKPRDQKDKARREVTDVDSNVFGGARSMDVDHVGARWEQTKVEVKSSGAGGPAPVISRTEILHLTSYRGVFFDEAPPNLLSMRDHECSAPFESDCDHPLTFYDETDTLISHCAILESFGKPTQCISSVFPTEVAKPQSDITLAVSSLVTAHLPIIRRCHQRKVQAILSEARQKVSAYQAALRKHRRDRGECNEMTPHILPRSSAEKEAVKQLKTLQHACDIGAGDVSFQIGRGESHVREKTLSSLVQINRSALIRPLRKYTTSVGLRYNYRVDDDPILRYTATTRPSGAGGGVGELSKKYGLRVGNVADEEVVEYVLRLVVGRLGDSEQVFHALKSELDFSQAYTTYSELKKLYDSRQRANARLDHVEKLGHDGIHTGDADVAALVNLMEQSSLSQGARARSLARRLQPPIRSLESSIVDSLVDSASAGLAALGLRATDSYNELVDVYCGSFCRMCYTYNCHDHGGDHPLPARRVDPAYPRVGLAPRAACGDGSVGVASRVAVWGSSSDEEEVVYLGREMSNTKPMVDPSEYVDASHVPLVTRKMRSFLSTSSICDKLCWKAGDLKDVKGEGNGISAVALGVLRKLRETMGDNSCLLAAVVGSASCGEVHRWIEKEKASGEYGTASRRTRNWKRGRRSGGSNHELVQRTRNQRLQDRGTANHEYEPCMHEGMCDSTGCSCMKRDHMCEKACACSRDCPNRFEGCSCSPGECRTSKCPCFTALRECDPDVCVECGASELAVYSSVMDGTVAGTTSRRTCCNMNVIRRKHKRLGMSFSSIHGYGMYALEPILASEFVYEYNGAVLSQDEAERRGLIYDKMEMSYLFDLNEDAVLDALRDGNKSKFINHEGEAPNCTAKVVSVSGVHHITIWALCDIAVGDELMFDYGYKRGVGPDWSQRREVSKDTS
ncbi:hypothetical protein V7S43_007979 [Phytophthora oleae]